MMVTLRSLPVIAACVVVSTASKSSLSVVVVHLKFQNNTIKAIQIARSIYLLDQGFWGFGVSGF